MNYVALEASNGSGESARATVQSPGRSIGSSVIPVNAITNWPTGPCIVTTGTLQANNTITNAQVFYGTASGTSVTITSFAPGYSDLGNSAGDVVVIKPTTEWANLVATFINNATGNGTPEAQTVSTLTASGAIVGATLRQATSVLLDGRTNATYRYTPTSTDVSNGYINLTFAHGLSYTPFVGESYVTSFGGTPAQIWPLPTFDASNTSYFGNPPSLWMGVQKVDATNIYFGLAWADALGLSVVNSSVGQIMKFIFFCKPTPG